MDRPQWRCVRIDHDTVSGTWSVHLHTSDRVAESCIDHYEVACDRQEQVDWFRLGAEHDLCNRDAVPDYLLGLDIRPVYKPGLAPEPPRASPA